MSESLFHNTDPALLCQIAGCLLDYIFHGNPQDIGSPEDARLVKYWVARFGSPKKIITDEPLALLVVVDYFTKQTKWTLPYFLKEGPSNSDPSARGIASDYFGTYALALAFSHPPIWAMSSILLEVIMILRTRLATW